MNTLDRVKYQRVVAIDGPGGSGKSTLAKVLAGELGLTYIDTGAMYRAVTWAAIQQELDLQQSSKIAKLASSLKIEFDGQTVFVNGCDVTDAIRSTEVTRSVSDIADNPEVRAILVTLQQRTAADGNFVCEGRDQGTVAFPNAECRHFSSKQKLS